MSDVIAAALIAAGASTIVAAVGYVVTYRVAKLSVFTEDARLRHEAQLEQTRLEIDARAIRRADYLKLLDHIEALDLMTSDDTEPPTREAFADWLIAFRQRTTAARLLESPQVADARRELSKVIDKLAERMQRFPPTAPFEDRLGYPYVELREQLYRTGRALSQAMRDDLGLSAGEETPARQEAPDTGGDARGTEA
jgi:hypothetical protein